MIEYLSSDTNVWIDFNLIGKVDLPFKLDCAFIMFHESIQAELLYPPGIRENLLSLGLIPVDITIDELIYAGQVNSKYPPLSKYDSIALAIAKKRSITLVTGDRALRSAAQDEGVQITGTLGILKRLYEENKIGVCEYKKCLKALKDKIGQGVRLPVQEIDKELNSLR